MRCYLLPILWCQVMWGTPIKQGTSDILGKISFFGIIVKSTLSALVKFLLLLLFEIWPFCVWDFEQFLWECDFDKLAFNISKSKHNHKKNAQLLWENVWKSVKNYSEVLENIKLRYVENQKSKKSTDL